MRVELVPRGLVPPEGGLLVAVHGCWRKVETGVGGGAKGSSALLDNGEMTVLVSCSSTSDAEDGSSSQNSATWIFLVFDFVIDFLTIGLGTSGSGLLLLIDRDSKDARRAFESSGISESMLTLSDELRYLTANDAYVLGQRCGQLQ